MSLERAIEDQRLMDQIYAFRSQHPRLLTEHCFDIIIIGSGAGGGTMARALAGTGARILVLERGDFIPQEDQNWNPDGGLEAAALSHHRDLAGRGGPPFRPYTHYCVGGNTKFWGTVLYRLRREDFKAIEHIDGISPAWPIDYETLAPYYERAEAMYHVHGEARAPIPPKARAGPTRTRRCLTPPSSATSSSS